MSDESESKSKPVRRIISNSLTPIKPNEIAEVPPVDNILSKAISVIANEVDKLSSMSFNASRTSPMQDKTARILQGHIKTIIELSKEQREREKMDDLSKMSDSELMAAAKEILSKMNVKP